MKATVHSEAIFAVKSGKISETGVMPAILSRRQSRENGKGARHMEAIFV